MRTRGFVYGAVIAAMAAVGVVAIAAAEGNHALDRAFGSGRGTGQEHPAMQPRAATNNPMFRSALTPFLLPEMQTELGLNDEQTAQLKQIKQEFIGKERDLAAKIASKEKDLTALFAPDTSKGQQVKALLSQIADFRVQQVYAAYEVSRKMKAALTEEQRNRFESLKSGELMTAMMNHLTMADMMRIRRFVGGHEMIEHMMGSAETGE